MSQALNKKISPKTLLRFAIPSVVMMMVLSLYSIIDGLFVSNFVSTDALGAINIVYPIISLGLGISIMLGSGGSAIIGRKLGEGKDKEAKSILTFLVVVSITIALIVMILGSIFIDPLVHILGATSRQYELAKTYLQIHFYFLVFFYLQNIFQIFFATASKAHIGLLTTIGAGIVNIILDYLFIVVFDFGITGAALGTGLSYLIPSIAGISYFSFNKKGILHFAKFKIDFKVLKTAMFNGSSEMLTNIANAVSTFLFNYQFLKYYAEDGVAAITIVLYFQFLISAAFFGYSQGTAPIISYKYGSRNKKELKDIRKYSIITLVILGLIGFVVSLGLIYPVAILFSGGNENVFNIVTSNFILFAFAFIFMGISIFTSSWYTALGDGFNSALISVLRTLVYLSLAIMICPLIFNDKGLWLATTVAEVLGVITAVVFMKFKTKRLDLLDLAN